MEKFDEQLEKRVWQRIHGEGQVRSLQSLAVSERGNAAAYLRLTRMTQGAQKNLLRRLYERERQHEQCLSGMSRMMEGKNLSVRTLPPAADDLTTALRKCYTASLQAAAEYDRRSPDGEYGCVFRRLAREEKENCAMILEILGS